jgi:hypothetical protein
MTTEIHEEKIIREADPAANGPLGAVERHEEVHVIQNGGGEYRQQITENVGAERRIQLSKAVQFIWLVTGLVEAFIGLRIVLKLIAANPNTPVARFVYNLTDLVLWPFFGLTVTPATDSGIILELSSFVAMVVYIVAAWALLKVLYLVFTPSSSRTVSVYDQRYQ